MKYKLIVKRGGYEYHFAFKKVSDAAAFAEEFMKHQVLCEDDVSVGGSVKETTFCISFEKADENASTSGANAGKEDF